MYKPKPSRTTVLRRNKEEGREDENEITLCNY